MTCTYDFRWRHIYVKCPITSGSHELDPQNPNFSFRHNFTKKYFFSKVRLIPDSARSDLSKEPIKSGYLWKMEKKGFPWKHVPSVRSALFAHWLFPQIIVLNKDVWHLQGTNMFGTYDYLTPMYNNYGESFTRHNDEDQCNTTEIILVNFMKEKP